MLTKFSFIDIFSIKIHGKSFSETLQILFSGDLMHEEQILEWVLDLHESTPDIIESVDRKTLQVLISSVEHLAVFFCKLYFNYIEQFYFTSSKKTILILIYICWEWVFPELLRYISIHNKHGNNFQSQKSTYAHAHMHT
jgi:hypothetical protein